MNMKITVSRSAAVKTLLLLAVTLLLSVIAHAQRHTYLGRLSANPYAADSTSNKYGTYGSRYSPTSVNNPYGKYGSPYSAYSATNPYATRAPKIFASDGTYLGKLSANRYDPESVSNAYGNYGSPYSPTSINNRFGVYGSRYSHSSPSNPYATSAPIIVSGK